MPEVQTGQDGSFTVQEDSIELSKVQAAERELAEEAEGSSPDLILGKYETTEDLAKAYQSLQSEFSKFKASQGAGETEPAAEAENTSQPDQPAQETRQEQAPSKTPEQTAQVEQALLQHLGGMEKYQQLAQWASSKFDDAAKQAYNEAVNSGDVNRAMTAVKSLQFDYMMDQGVEQKLASGRPAAPVEKGFASEAQVVAAMSDPRYSQGPDHDPAYVAEVERKLSISNVFAAS